MKTDLKLDLRTLSLGFVTSGIVLLTSTSCGGGGSGVGSSIVTPGVASSIQTTSVIDSSGVPHGGTAVSGSLVTNGTAPALTSGSAGSAVSIVRGGSALITLTSPSALANIYLGISGVSGYYQISLATTSAIRDETVRSRGSDYWLVDPNTSVHVHVRPERMRATNRSSTTTYTLSLTVPTNLTSTAFSAVIVGDYGSGSAISRPRSSGNLTPPLTVPVSVLASGSSSQFFQASLAWSLPVDVDLHVTPPGGTEIGYDNRTSVGGALDTDSNPACNIDNKDQENIRWLAAAPVGVYRIRPDYYEACQQSDIRYAVTIHTPQSVDSAGNDQPVQYIDTFTAAEADGNNNASVDNDHVIYCCVLPSTTTDAGLLSTLMLAEIGNPSAGYTAADSSNGALAIRAVVENRKAAPRLFAAPNSTTAGIIFANGSQFAGFYQNGTIDPTITARVKGDLFPNSGSQPASDWVVFWNSVLTAATQSYTESSNDPFANVLSVGGTTTIGGSYGVRTHGSSGPGGNFVLAGTAAGQDFYTLLPGVL
jgi:hypothetical protein